MKENDAGGLLSAEQVAALQTKYPTRKTPVERKEASRQRQRDKRARVKAEKESQAAMSQAEGIQQFWAESLKTADPEKLAEWKARQDYVEAILGDIRTCLEGREPDTEFIDDVDDEIRADIKEHGVTGVTVPLLIGEYWQNPELLARLTNGDSPSVVFAKYGYLLSIDDYTQHKWNAFIASHRASKLPPEKLTVTYVAMNCSQCNALPTSVSSAIAEAYARKAYMCLSCFEKAAKVRNFNQERTSNENTIFDSWGRQRQ